jgi:hypothetical protein
VNQKKSSGSAYVFFFCFVLGFLSPSQLFAEEPVRIQTVVQPKELEEGDIFVVNIEVSSKEMVSVDTPNPPQIAGATLRGQTQAQRTNAGAVMGAGGEVEFRRTVTQIFTYQYSADRAGDTIVPSVSIVAGGQAYKSSPAQIKVFPSGSGRKVKRPPSRARPDFFGEEEDTFGADPFSADPFDQVQKMDDQFKKLLERHFGGSGPQFQAVPNFNEKDAFVIVAEVDKTEAYKGEQITASWYLYTKSGVRDIDTLKYPDLKGFWKEDIELATLLNFQPAELNGKPYNKALLASYALFPIEDGKATVDGYKAKVTVVAGFGQAITSTKTSQAIPILVKPLPEAGRPASFSGAVGEYQIKAQVESNSVVAHQPFTLRVHVEGRGNAKQFELPNPTLPSSVELYDIKKDSKFFKNGLSYKSFEIFLIPRQEGELIIPPIVTSVFNPRTQKYEDLATPELKLNVLKGTGQQGLQASRLQKDASGDAEAEEPLQMLTEWTPTSESSEPSWLLWLSLGVLSVIGLLGYATYELRWFQKPPGMRELYQIRAQKLRTTLAQKKWRELGVEATNLSAFVLGQISGQGGAHLQTEKLIEKASPSVRRHLGTELQKILEKFYFLGFGPEELALKSIDESRIAKDWKDLDQLLQKSIELSATDMKV